MSATPTHLITQTPAPGRPKVGTPTTLRATDYPFPRRLREPSTSLLVDDILPSGALLEFVPVDVLNGYINHVDIHRVITERDPEEDDRHISVSNRFYTHFHELGTVIHVIGSSLRHLWYFCYDIDAADCAIGRVLRDQCSLERLEEWVRQERVSRRYPVVEIDTRHLRGFRSFQ